MAIVPIYFSMYKTIYTMQHSVTLRVKACYLREAKEQPGYHFSGASIPEGDPSLCHLKQDSSHSPLLTSTSCVFLYPFPDSLLLSFMFLFTT